MADALTPLEALRAIIADADKRPGGDGRYQEISRDVMCDARRALTEHDREFLATAGRPRCER